LQRMTRGIRASAGLAEACAGALLLRRNGAANHEAAERGAALAAAQASSSVTTGVFVRELLETIRTVY
jgi:hypothetical protein